MFFSFRYTEISIYGWPPTVSNNIKNIFVHQDKSWIVYKKKKTKWNERYNKCYRFSTLNDKSYIEIINIHAQFEIRAFVFKKLRLGITVDDCKQKQKKSHSFLASRCCLLSYYANHELKSFILFLLIYLLFLIKQYTKIIQYYICTKCVSLYLAFHLFD